MLGNPLCCKLGSLLEFLTCPSCREFFARGFTPSPLQGSSGGVFPSQRHTPARCLAWQRVAVASGRAAPSERGGGKVSACGRSITQK